MFPEGYRLGTINQPRSARGKTILHILAYAKLWAKLGIFTSLQHRLNASTCANHLPISPKTSKLKLYRVFTIPTGAMPRVKKKKKKKTPSTTTSGCLRPLRSLVKVIISLCQYPIITLPKHFRKYKWFAQVLASNLLYSTNKIKRWRREVKMPSFCPEFCIR